jgi:hypothetical protein
MGKNMGTSTSTAKFLRTHYLNEWYTTLCKFDVSSKGPWRQEVEIKH